jgi:hypothetical protein
MATLYLKAAGGNFNDAATWSTTGSGGGDNSGPPTAADNLILEAGSGNLTIAATAACRSLDCTSGTGTYTGTITHNSGITLSIGDGTAGAGNVAIKLDAGMTWTRGASSSAVSFVSTSGTQQTILQAGKNFGNTTFNGAGGSWIFSDTFQCTTAAFTLTAGSLDTNGQTMTVGTFSSSNSNVRSLTLGASSITVQQFPNAVVFTTVTNLTFSGGSSTVNMSATGDQSFGGGGLTWGTVIFSNFSGNTKAITGANTFGTLTITGSANKTDAITLAANQTVTGTFTVNGNSTTNRVLVMSSVTGTSRTITAATVTVTNAGFQDITGAGAGSWDLSAITGGSGDCGGNSGITFTAAATQYWFSNTGSWSDSSKWFLATNGGGGAGRVPLPQDDVVFDANSFSTSGRVVTQDMPRAGKSINWTGATNNPQWTMGVSASIFGSLTLISAMSMTNTSAYTFEGRGSFTLTTAGLNIGRQIQVLMPGGTFTLQDAYTSTASFQVLAGTFNSNGFSITATQWVSTGTLTRTVNLSTSSVTITGTSANIFQNASTDMTWNASSSTITITSVLAGSHNIVGAGLTYGRFVNATTGSPNFLIITGSNTFKLLEIGAGITQKFTAGTTQTISRLIAMGASGSVISILSATGGSAVTIAQAGGVSAGDWMSLQDITFSATSNATFYAGPNSTNVSGNTGILFKQLTGMNMSSMGYL